MTSPQVLVVDDEENIQFFVAEALTRIGLQVTTAANGQAALEYIATQTFDLALLDLQLKDISGMEILKALRQRAPETVVIMLTAYATLETAVEALRQGAHDYLFKPVGLAELRQSVQTGLQKRERTQKQRELLGALEQVLRPSPTTERLPPNLPQQLNTALPQALETTEPPPASLSASREPTLQCGPLTINFEQHIISVAGQALELSPTEFNLLAHLARRAPRVVTQQELIREAQGYTDDAIWDAPDTLRFHIYRLRRKLQAIGHADLIRTVRGVGYTLQE